MRTTWALSALLIVGCLLIGGAGLYGQADNNDYTVIIKKVEVKRTQANGNAWDPNDGLPDLYVHARNSSDEKAKAFSTKTKDDATTADFNEPTAIKCRLGQTIEFRVLDKDAAADDEIGRVRLILTEKALKDGTNRLENFGQVIHLEVELKKL